MDLPELLADREHGKFLLQLCDEAARGGMDLSALRAGGEYGELLPQLRDGEAGGEHTVVELCNYPAPVKLIF